MASARNGLAAVGALVNYAPVSSRHKSSRRGFFWPPPAVQVIVGTLDWVDENVNLDDEAFEFPDAIPGRVTFRVWTGDSGAWFYAGQDTWPVGSLGLDPGLIVVMNDGTWRLTSKSVMGAVRALDYCPAAYAYAKNDGDWRFHAEGARIRISGAPVWGTWGNYANRSINIDPAGNEIPTVPGNAVHFPGFPSQTYYSTPGGAWDSGWNALLIQETPVYAEEYSIAGDPGDYFGAYPGGNYEFPFAVAASTPNPVDARANQGYIVTQWWPGRRVSDLPPQSLPQFIDRDSTPIDTDPGAID
jgi:hypothetical protein